MSLRCTYFIDEAFFFFCVKKQNYDVGTTLFKRCVVRISRFLDVRLKELYCVLVLNENREF